MGDAARQKRKLTFPPERPRLCIPLVSPRLPELLQDARALSSLPCDLVEWRADCFEACRDEAAVLQALAALREALGELPLLFTFRSEAEGGRARLPWQDYAHLTLAAAATGHIDLADVELFSAPQQDVARLTARLHAAGCAVILSSHDFDATPPEDELMRRLALARSLGADLPKVAVMPHREEDVLTLLAATLRANREGLGPLITMSMGPLGGVSRLCGRLFGSAVTFGSAGEASAPGQFPAAELHSVLSLLEQYT